MRDLFDQISEMKTSPFVADPSGDSDVEAEI